MPNRLATESSPYLLQHAGNPVDWYPWGREALDRAVAEDKPIFLSIGYSACHWCHVMEHESFENAGIARLMNEHFVCIKVDREERPDLDQIYMNAVQIMTGRGGWPMSVFLSPDGKPFYGGTYWPPTGRGGMPGFDQVLVAVADAWKNRRQQALEQADSLTEHLSLAANAPGGAGPLNLELIDRAAAAIERSFDATHGGFGAAPKFPHPMDLRLALRAWQRRGPQRGATLLHVVELTLDKMAAGGIYDQLGGGFHRYSTDAHWLVPHFEKMLYDNAQLAVCYLETFQATGRAEFARVARETFEYVLREMTDPAGGFYSTQDADSEGEEGKFFVWTPPEIEAVLGPARSREFCYVYDVTPEGNFEHGQSILNRGHTLEQAAKVLGRDAAELERELAEGREKLLMARYQRIAPGLDDKVLVAWNGLMIDALAQAAGVLDEPRYLSAAQRAADFVLTAMRRPDGRLLHTWRGGQSRLDAYLDDYATLANALVSLYEADFDERWIGEAMSLADTMLAQFADAEQGGFYFTAADHEQLILRQKDLYDNAVPSGNAMAALVLVRLAKLTGNARYQREAERTLSAAAGVMQQASRAAGQMLLALDLYLGPTPEIVVVGDAEQGDTAVAIRSLRHRFLARRVLACRRGDRVGQGLPALADLFAGKQPQGEAPTVYVCENFTCGAPIQGLAAAEATWQQLAERR